MFFLKKLISAFLLPLPIFFIISAFGLALLWFGRRKRTGKVLITAGVLWLALFSWGAFPTFLLKPLERSVPSETSRILKSGNDFEYIVVLGGGHVSDPAAPATGRISGDSLARLVEAVALYRKTPGARLILSGGRHRDPVSNAALMAEIAGLVGVDKKDVTIEEQPLDTKDEAMILSQRVGKKPFFLVTSAAHMPRAVALFRKQGANPVPVPTAHRIKTGKNGAGWSRFFPKSSNIKNAEIAFHERLGLIWAEWVGQI